MQPIKDLVNVLQMDPGRFQPDPAFAYRSVRDYVLDQQFLALLVGAVALGLPFAMLFGVLVGTCFYDSISHFYYSQFFGDVLVMALAFIGTFLIAYRGENFWENRLATLAGFCAYGIAVFPTSGRGCEEKAFAGRALVDLLAPWKTEPVTVVPATRLGQFFELFANVNVLHFGSAALLFAFLAFYSFYVFTRVIPREQTDAEGRLTPVKRRRNRIYIWSGWVIVFSMLAMATNALVSYVTGESWAWWTAVNATFWFEALALWAFGVSWMVKGRFWKALLADPRDRTAAAPATA
ncbi:MAG: hypothetical protein QNJ30_08955 [Kiloniellales bacterium]|nr:hypothetical protein [Kiloniellales bacterium]